MSSYVSVIIPVYNAEQFIGAALQSVLNQTEQRFEIIVVDDSSTDATAAVVQSFSDPRIHLLTNETNLGVSASRNRAIKHASGDWIALLDADDWWRSERLERLLHHAESHEADLVADDIYFIDDGKLINLEHGVYLDFRGYSRPLHRLFRNTDFPHRLTIEEFVEGRIPGESDPRTALVKPLVRRSFLENLGIQYEMDANHGEDYVFYLDCLGNDAKFILVNEIQYCYRVHQSMTSNTDLAAAQANRKKINAMLMQRSYVQSDPLVKRRLKRRHQQLQREIQLHKLYHTLNDKGSDLLLLFMINNPIYLYHILTNEIKECLGHNISRIGRIPIRLSQMIGLISKANPSEYQPTPRTPTELIRANKTAKS